MKDLTNKTSTTSRSTEPLTSLVFSRDDHYNLNPQSKLRPQSGVRCPLTLAMKIPLIILSMIFFVGSVFAESAPDSTTKPVVITPEQETQRVAERQIVPKFEIRDGTISEAARTLEEWLTQSLKQSKSSPIAITVDQVYFKNKKRVTLLTKNTSVFTICTVLAEQIGAEVVFKENEIHFWAGVWDEID